MISFRSLSVRSTVAALPLLLASVSPSLANTAAEYRARAAESQAKAEKAERIHASLVRAGGRFQQHLAPIQADRVRGHRRQQAEFNRLAEAAGQGDTTIRQ